MQDSRRGFIKKTLGVGAVAATVGVSAMASEKGAISGSNGVVKGKSKKKRFSTQKQQTGMRIITQQSKETRDE